MQQTNGLPAVWQAKWIDPEPKHDKKTRQPASVLRRFFTAHAFCEARLFITCHGLYEATLNGSRVGDFVLAPGAGDYRKRLQVQVYDVTPLLKEGENELRVTLGDGWYRGCNGIDGCRNLFGSDLALLCQLEADGKVIVCSDASWEASQSGPIRQNDMELGERCDARMEPVADWHGVKERAYGCANLVPTETVPIKEQERFSGRILKTPNGETVIDFGQNLAGYTELRVKARAGQKLTLWHGETLDEHGNFTQSNFDPGARNKNGGIPQKIEYICKDGENVFKPHFCIFGFRYAKLETDVDLSDAAFTSIAVYSDIPQVGFFECGNADVNRLFLNSLWSMRSNFCDIPTDCPTRERAGWTGDAGVFVPTAMFLADCYPVFRKWLAECRLAQGRDGRIANIAPPNSAGGFIGNLLRGAAGWGDACISVPWALYEATGRTEILQENYDMMTRWLAFSTKRAKKTRKKNRSNPYRDCLVDTGFHFGEWLEPDVPAMQAMRKNMRLGAPEVATAYFFRSASLLGEIATILGKTDDAERFGRIAENAKKAYRFAQTKDGVITSDRQCEYVRPIAFGLLEGEEARRAADALDELVKKNGYHLNTGFLSTPDLCRVLADYGHAETAYRLLLQDTCPSWLYAVKKGATTIWETWDGVRPNGTVHDSLNHYAYGAISGWLFSGVCGIRRTHGALCIEPKPNRALRFAKAKWLSNVGCIESAWGYEDDRVLFIVTVPIPATIKLPNGTVCKVEAGTHTFETEEKTK